MGEEQAHRGPIGPLTGGNPVGFQSPSAARRSLPEPEESEGWYIWEVRLVAPDGEDHAWLVVSGMIEQDQVARHLLATDPDFRQIGRAYQNQALGAIMEFNRYPFGRSYQSQRFEEYEVAHAVAFFRASVLWEEGMITHGP